MKLGILGAGMIVGHFLEMAKDLPEIEVTSILGTKRSYDKLMKIQADNNIDQAFTDFDEFLEKSDMDTVYVALPNHLHYEYAKKSLEAGKHVICEKPFTLTLAEFMELKKLALAKDLVLVEAITNQYLGNYQTIKEIMPELGELKIMECNYSQYSSRYDAFKEGTILPAFNPKMGGGALMDINIYNIHFAVGLLGKPSSVHYLPNVERNIDTSGVLILDYPNIKVVCIGAKDSTSEIRTTIQGNKGSILINGSSSLIVEVEKQLIGEEAVVYQNNAHLHRMHEEFAEFYRMITEHDMKEVEKQLNHSQLVMEVVDKALASGNIQLG
ncbi:Gfo/Idh/MocA family protein [Vagococcus fluvialis]|uniref:Gfo/Idh/MocA family protein n=1 Tax=Vagococcus fluvialis TaxID=2738 RepID=UPI003B5B778D